jgi:hypothetical protein
MSELIVYVDSMNEIKGWYKIFYTSAVSADQDSDRPEEKA